MNVTVIDSSVAYKWLCPDNESGVQAAEALLDAHESGELVLAAPDFLHVELCSAVRNSSYLNEESGTALVGELDAYRLELFPSSVKRLSNALRLSYRHNLSIYDALFLQLAVELDCPLVTADRKAFVGIDTPVEIRLL